MDMVCFLVPSGGVMNQLFDENNTVDELITSLQAFKKAHGGESTLEFYVDPVCGEGANWMKIHDAYYNTAEKKNLVSCLIELYRV